MLNLHINIYYNQMVEIYYQNKSRKGLYTFLRWSKVSGQTQGTSECSNSKGTGFLYNICGASLLAQVIKNLPACGRPRFSPWVGKIPWRREWLSTPVFLPGEFHGQRSLAGYSPWGHKELYTTEQLTHR